MTSALILNIDVPDLAKAVAFYEAAFGFTRSRLLFDGSIAEMTFSGLRIYLIEQPQGSAAITDAPIARDYADHWTPVHFDLAVESVDDALKRALAAGARLSGEVGRHDWGDIARLRDPFGHGICLIRFHEAPYANALADRDISALDHEPAAR